MKWQGQRLTGVGGGEKDGEGQEAIMQQFFGEMLKEEVIAGGESGVMGKCF